MLAIRSLLASLSLLSLVSVCLGQAPLTDPVRGRIVHSSHPNVPKVSEWTPPRAVVIHGTNDVGTPADPVNLDEHHGDGHGASIVNSDVLKHEAMPAGSQACACGQAMCPGVCRDPGRPKKPRIDKPGDRNRGDCPPYRYRMSDQKRAGNPQRVAPWATCSVNSKYSAWFVGGGSPFRLGRCRKPSEGTWGLDYGGFFGHAKVWLNYTRGRNQGGEGAYETDGEPEFVSRAHEIMGIGH